MTSTNRRSEMTELKMTTHARARQRQRGMAAGVLEAVLTFGDTYRAGEGCTAYYLGQQAARRHSHALRGVVDRAQNVAIVVSGDGAVVSVQHVPRPKRRWSRIGVRK